MVNRDQELVGGSRMIHVMYSSGHQSSHNLKMGIENKWNGIEIKWNWNRNLMDGIEKMHGNRCLGK